MWFWYTCFVLTVFLHCHRQSCCIPLFWGLGGNSNWNPLQFLKKKDAHYFFWIFFAAVVTPYLVDFHTVALNSLPIAERSFLESFLSSLPTFGLPKILPASSLSNFLGPLAHVPSLHTYILQLRWKHPTAWFLLCSQHIQPQNSF